MSRVALDGDWQLKGFLGVDAGLSAATRWRDGTGQGAAEQGWLAGRVPGTVLDDVWRAGEVPDPYRERNSLAAEWVPERTWIYRRTFRLEPGRPRDRLFLRFDGIDHAAHVYLDGELLGRHEGMFVPFEFEVTDRLGDAAEHRVAVVVEPAPSSESQVGRTSRVRIHKSRMGYGWDFCPRMIHQGIWQSAWLERVGDARILDVWARPVPAGDAGTALVDMRLRLDVASAGTVGLEARLSPGGTQLETGWDLPAGVHDVAVQLPIERPAAWWPNGLGEPALHRLAVRVCGEDGAVDERTVPVGFRTIELEPNEGARSDALPYTFIVNGRRTYIRGWNWVPVDVMYGVPRPERLHHLVRLARNAGVNLFRVWGGGLIETEAFYDACDRAGIMVWQEFSQSSSGVESTPADDPAFVRLMTHEAEAIVPLRRNHPSLALWCGGNELEDERGPLGTDAPVLAALAAVVRRLDPDRVWLPTSPSGPVFHNRLDTIERDPAGLHDVHGPWEHQGLRAHYRLYDRGTSLFSSEFGVEGMTNRRTHEALIGPAHRWPATRANPVYRHLGDWWNNESLVAEAFGGRLTDLETLRRASQFLQAEGLRYAIEANRRRAFRNSGSIPWQFNESYPNAWCTAAVDHHGDPKPAYHAVARAYQPIVVCASFAGIALAGDGRFAAKVWAWSDVRSLRAASVTARLLGTNGEMLGRAEWEVALPDGPALEVGAIEADLPPEPAIVLLDLELATTGGTSTAVNRYLFSTTETLEPLLDLPPARVDAAFAEAGDRWQLRIAHREGPAALGLTVEDDRPIEAPGWAEVSENAFDLRPGEERTIVVSWPGAPSAGRRLRVSAWNVAPTAVAAEP